METEEPWVTTILSEEAVKAVVKKVREEIGEDNYEEIKLADVNPEHIARCIPLAERCRQSRTEQGLTLGAIARTLKVRVAELQQIESAEITEIKPEILQNYVSHLKIDEWYSAWAQANEGIIECWKTAEPEETQEPALPAPPPRTSKAKRNPGPRNKPRRRISLRRSNGAASAKAKP